MGTVLNKLSGEDLARWRNVVADKELVASAYPGMSISEARQAMFNYYKLLGDIFVDYGIDTSLENLYVSPVSGEVLTFGG